MVTHSILVRSLRNTRNAVFIPAICPRYRCLATSNASPGPSSSQPSPNNGRQSWLTRKINSSPSAKKVFVKFANALGYGSPKSVAGRRAFNLYQDLCVGRADEESAYWMNECHLPPTFQSWFTITNLHIWLLTVRLRALPSPHGNYFVQALIDHFFLDIEDRIRAVLQPGLVPEPYTRKSDFYSVPKPLGENGKPKLRAPERLVTQQMKIFREQWNGMGVALDLGLVRGDAEMAGAVWRNLLGARGARGIVLPSVQGAKKEKVFRRSINPSGEIEKYGKMDEEALEAEESKDDGSGVHDFGPDESDQYVRYPETMVTLIAYMRRELVRLEGLSDEVVLGAMKIGTERQGVQKMRFGPVKGSRI